MGMGQDRSGESDYTVKNLNSKGNGSPDLYRSPPLVAVPVDSLIIDDLIRKGLSARV